MPMHLPEDQLNCLRKLQQGDAVAFNDVFHHFYSPLIFFACKMVQDKPLAEDIVTDIFLKLWQKHTDFSTIQSIKAFLYISTRNACLNHLQQAQYQGRVKQQIRYLQNESQDFVLNEITRAEVLREVSALVRQLPRQCRKIICLSYLGGLTNQEIADRLKLSVHTVRNQKVRGVQLLRNKMDNELCHLSNKMAGKGCQK
jgi:RNA polymerase sigma-70 factor (family 1)